MDNNKITKDECIQKCLIFKSYNPHNNTIPKNGGYVNYYNRYPTRSKRFYIINYVYIILLF